jgi:hypothetical protein
MLSTRVLRSVQSASKAAKKEIVPMSRRATLIIIIFHRLTGWFRKRGKTRGVGMIIRFPRGRESDSLWGCLRLPTSMAFHTPI